MTGRMDKKPIPFPTQPPAAPPQAPHRSYARLILNLGDRKFAVEFFARATELHPQPAPILMSNRPQPKKRQKSRDGC